MQAPFFKCSLENKDTLQICCSGLWSIFNAIPKLDELHCFLLTNHGIKQMSFKVMESTQWDSSFVKFLFQCQAISRQHAIQFNLNSLPLTVQHWFQLLDENTNVEPAVSIKSGKFSLYKGLKFESKFWKATWELVCFWKEILEGTGMLLSRSAKWRSHECLLMMQQMGVNALPIVCLISFLVGLTMAFVGSAQLSQFGANIYVANLVGLAIVREMGAMMTGVILAGRTGAALAASLATMKVTEEIEALKTFGIAPITFLVLPRIVAVCLITPLLCLFSNFIGMLGGLSVGVTVMRLSWRQYVHQTQLAVSIQDFSTGILKSFVFAFLIASIGCLKGLKCGNNAEAVGAATTSAVVSAITAIIIADSILTILFNAIGI
jgi:phospholipid/cholesterol/gamma-HCH transport system permease protein